MKKGEIRSGRSGFLFNMIGLVRYIRLYSLSNSKAHWSSCMIFFVIRKSFPTALRCFSSGTDASPEAKPATKTVPTLTSFVVAAVLEVVHISHVCRFPLRLPVKSSPIRYLHVVYAT
jgi:hypothetical protein